MSLSKRGCKSSSTATTAADSKFRIARNVGGRRSDRSSETSSSTPSPAFA
eukprot:CAMPEP_0172566836 /NCGR_PEP_ID=MMETSP1067-20121228/113417_1 /TAXON_ID=265564 ORGANISM="Thalassiosira punctigera, Strain Tpunct2005C2" /NCGR_SAMPLE_ID=MMETSP1067 /ASSEMBLY_ACC=CAM_ASM_000444 /LENGTH=49 /DNA_ID= /DNA_START= /DNA_END= /DNA_ORIENTATION=